MSNALLCFRYTLCLVYVFFIACIPFRIAQSASIDPVWQPLYKRLQQDQLAIPNLEALFISLGNTPSQDPMGRKITELYNSKLLRESKKPATKTTKARKPKAPPIYKTIVTAKSAKLCLAYIKKHQAAFNAAEKSTGVSPSIAAALLFLETRLGTMLGKENAFVTLASMAATRSPDNINTYLVRLPEVQKHLPWVIETMQKRSDWAYKELQALLVFSVENKLDLSTIPGSMYGAIGICQFMPSNINKYTTDGNNDGIIDLFTPTDAIASLAYYLKEHGWKKRMSRSQQHRVLRKYNHSNIYANTILALSDRIRRVQKRSKP